MLAFSEQGFSPLFEGDRNILGELNWVHFPLGYRQFRRTVGLDDTKVNLQLTGQMLHDLIVTVNASQTRKFIGARRLNGKFIKGKVGSGNKVIGKLKLKIEFSSPESEILAGYIENGRYPRKFVFFTDNESTIIADAFSEAVRAQLRGEDPLGEFSKFGF